MLENGFAPNMSFPEKGAWPNMSTAGGRGWEMVEAGEGLGGTENGVLPNWSRVLW